jgi:hypothetical protein
MIMQINSCLLITYSFALVSTRPMRTRLIMQSNQISAFDQKHLYTCLKNSLIIHEENTKKNHKRVVSVQGESKKTDTFVIHLNIKCISFFWLTLYMWYRFMLIYINFNFDFLGLDNVYF